MRIFSVVETGAYKHGIGYWPHAIIHHSFYTREEAEQAAKMIVVKDANWAGPTCIFVQESGLDEWGTV